jgi:endonuclease/exonuclease/phosphatase family metal-dependent hydrolase
MRVATLNVWGRAGDWAARRAALRRSIADLQPDLLALQETFGAEHTHEFLDPMNVVHQRRHAPDGGGISIASRLPIKAVHELDLHVGERPRDFAAGAVMVEVEDPPLLFVNHFPSWQLDQENEREQQAVMVARRIEELRSARDLHVVVAGDMDADPSSTSIRFWTGRHSLSGFSVSYSDAWETRHPGEVGETINFGVHEKDWPFKRIDYVLVRCGVHGGPTLKIERCERWADQPVDGVWPSDHFGVFADLST